MTVCMKLQHFVSCYPCVYHSLSDFFSSFDLSDPEYVVQYDSVSGDIEVGYPSDVWYCFPPPIVRSPADPARA